MELGNTGAAGREPIVFDVSALPEGQRLGSDNFALFVAGRASFGDEVKDAVAASHGIDEEGRLDMDMLAAAEAAESYLRGRQGQPVVLADIIRDEQGNVIRVDALLGVLSKSEKLVGIFRGRHGGYGGVALEGGCYELSAFSFPAESRGPVRLERVVAVEDGIAHAGVMPFDRHAVTLGHPEGDNPRLEWQYTQELIAGEDIMQWVRDQFGEEEAGYDIWTGLLRGIRNADAQQYLLRQPFLAMYKRELATLDDISTELGRAGQRVEWHERARSGVLAEASLSLDALKEKAGPLAYRLPYTNDSDRRQVTAEVAGVPDIRARQEAVARIRHQLGGLVLPRRGA